MEAFQIRFRLQKWSIFFIYTSKQISHGSHQSNDPLLCGRRHPHLPTTGMRFFRIFKRDSKPDHETGSLIQGISTRAIATDHSISKRYESVLLRGISQSPSQTSRRTRAFSQESCSYSIFCLRCFISSLATDPPALGLEPTTRIAPHDCEVADASRLPHNRVRVLQF